MYKYLLLVFLFVFGSYNIVFPKGRVENTAVQETEENDISVDSEKYHIVDVQYVVRGFVLEAALETKLKLRTGKADFSSREEFYNYIKLKDQDLKNLRQLKESSAITTSYKWNTEQQYYEAILKVFVTDNFNILILPYFSYSSNSGFLLSARGRDYNFLGSLEPLSINFDYTLNENNQHGFGISFAFSYPFLYKKNIFSLGIEEEFSYRDDNFIEHKNKLSFNYNYLLASFVTLSSYISQSFTSESSPNIETNPFFSFGESEIGAGPSFTLNSTAIPIVGHFVYNPSASFYTKYSVTPDDPTPLSRYNQTVNIKQSFSFGRIDWIENFRRGITFSLLNENIYSIKETGWQNSLSVETIFHTTRWNRIGLTFRLYGVYNFYNYPNPASRLDKGTDLGNRLRGVIDYNFADAQAAIALNTGVSFRLFDIKPLFSFHLGPTFDVAIRQHISNDFNVEDDIKYSIALEGIAFALFSRSIVVRGSYGIDLGRVIKEGTLNLGNSEIFFGLSLYY